MFDKKDCHQYYEFSYENSPDISAIVDSSTRKILFCNNTFLVQLDHLSKADIIGKDILDVHPAIFHDELLGIFDEDISQTVLQVDNLELLMSNGEPITVNLQAKYYVDESQNKEYYLFSWRIFSKVQDKPDHLHCDDLTKLNNRKSYIKKLASVVSQAESNKLKFSVLHIDLDDFKKVNEYVGHFMGDQYLIEISQRLQDYCKDKYYLARIGGDEYAVIVNNLAETEEVCEELRELISMPVHLMDQEIVSTASIGIANYPFAGNTLVELMKHVGIAKHQSKLIAKGSYQFYSSALQAKTARKDTLKRDLKKAVEKEEIYIEYQPIVLAENETLWGLEALIRWQHPKLGQISPLELIPAAESTGLIKYLSEYIFERACREFSDIIHNIELNCDIKLSINLSTLLFLDQQLPEKILNLISKNKLQPQNILIEITESSLIEDFDNAQSILRKLKNEKVLIAIDDFGQGYSSLSYLNKLSFDYIKIDRFFIEDASVRNNQTLLKAIVSMSNDLGFKTIAEGVETRAQLNMVKKLGCDLIQGFFLYKPMPSHGVKDLILKDV